MAGSPTNAKWLDALQFYDGLQADGWPHIAAFRELVAQISVSPTAVGLTAVASHEVLLISPYTRYPDWFDGRHVKLHPLTDGTVRLERYADVHGPQASEIETVPIKDALPTVLRILARL
jgi:hypothetical protein